MITAPSHLRAALILLGLAAIITTIPAVDLALARLFYSPEAGGFPGIGSPTLDLIRKQGPVVLWGGIAVLAIACLAGRIARPAFGFLMASLILGPGLIVNALLKELWGRARPREIIDFGGDAAFTTAGHLTDACASNCSFTSGHAAFFFWLTALAFIAPERWRNPLLWGGIAAGTAMGVVRMMQGGHFASDVLWSGVIVLGATALLVPLFAALSNRKDGSRLS